MATARRGIGAQPAKIAAGAQGLPYAIAARPAQRIEFTRLVVDALLARRLQAHVCSSSQKLSSLPGVRQCRV